MDKFSFFLLVYREFGTLEIGFYHLICELGIRCNNLSSVEAGFEQNFCWEMGFVALQPSSEPFLFKIFSDEYKSSVTFRVFQSVIQPYLEKENPSSRNMSGTSNLFL